MYPDLLFKQDRLLSSFIAGIAEYANGTNSETLALYHEPHPDKNVVEKTTDGKFSVTYDLTFRTMKAHLKIDDIIKRYLEEKQCKDRETRMVAGVRGITLGIKGKPLFPCCASCGC